jgi:two-component system LytT family response regulator
MKKLRVLIVDDERMARQEVKRLLVPYPDMEIM